MRIPLLERVRFSHAVTFAVVLVGLQQIEGTSLYFSAVCALYVLISCLAFNAAGGFAFPSGSFIFFTATITTLIGLICKIFFIEPGDSNLRAPVLTLLTYCASMAVMGVVAALVRRLIPKGRSLLPRMSVGDAMKRAAAGAFLLGVVLQLITQEGARSEGSFSTAIRQINYFVQISILLATFYQVKVSGGRKGTNWVVWAGLSWTLFFGFLTFSKEGLLNPPVAWFVTAVVAGYNFTRKQILAGILGIIFFQVYLIPFTQYGRLFRDEGADLSTQVKTVFSLLLDIKGTRAVYDASAKDPYTDYGTRPHYFNTSHGIFDRICMLAPDDALTAYTEEGNTAGIQPTIFAFLNVIPHFFWKDKPFYYMGNAYAREIGIIAEDNETTGVSFSPTADAYHQLRWYGIFLILPGIFFSLFLVMDGLCGDIRTSPWGLFFVVVCAHAAPEGMVAGELWLATYSAFGLTLVALLSRYVLPKVAGIILDSGRSHVVSTTDFAPRLVPRILPEISKIGPEA